MHVRATDHKNMNLAQLNREVIRGKSGGKIIWQPRIICWYEDRKYSGCDLPEPYTGMDIVDLYKSLGCSNRIYEYWECIEKVEDPRVNKFSNKLSQYEEEFVIETPVGRITSIEQSNSSNYGKYPKKWWITCEEDMRVAAWIEEHREWKWNEETYRRIYRKWGDNGLPITFFPRVNVQNLFIETMGVEEGIYALYDYPETTEIYFKAMEESHERFIKVINESPIEIVNFGDNIHGGVLPPELFKKYVLPVYQKRNELLHKAGKFTHSHWDGDVRSLLQFAGECGLDGIEAITPKPQGDVTLEDVKAALGDEIFLIDGIAALLFDDIYPEEQLIEQTKRVIELFAPNLILGISDEMSSTGNIERIKLVGQIVDEYNASV